MPASDAHSEAITTLAELDPAIPLTGQLWVFIAFDWGELKVDAADLFERTGNVLKLIGDQYLARLYRLLAARFHLKDWERSIQRKLEILEEAYQVLIDQTTTSRGEFMEVIVIGLILIEVVLAIWRPH